MQNRVKHERLKRENDNKKPSEGAEANFNNKSKATKLTKAEQQQNTSGCELL